MDSSNSQAIRIAAGVAKSRCSNDAWLSLHFQALVSSVWLIADKLSQGRVVRRPRRVQLISYQSSSHEERKNLI